MPGVDAGGSVWLLKFDYFLSYLIAPVIAGVAVSIFILKYPRLALQDVVANRTLIIASLAVCLSILLSYVINGVHSKETFVAAINFVCINLFLILVVKRYASERIIWLFTLIVIVWSILPMFALLIPEFQKYVLQIPCDFQGAADGRLIYGFWSGVGLILLLNTASKTTLWKSAIYTAVSLVWFGLVISRSRAAMVAFAAGLFILCLYENWFTVRKVIVLILWMALIWFAGSFMWQNECANGMERTFEMDSTLSKPKLKLSDNENPKIENIQNKLIVKKSAHKNRVQNFNPENVIAYEDPTRKKIYMLFWDDVKDNWLIGHGKMNLLFIPGAGADGKGAVAEAHNIFLQLLSNYGLIALAAFLYWIIVFYLSLQTNRSRMLLAYLVVFSQFQPVFGGTTNLFACIPMLVFFLIMVPSNKKKNNLMEEKVTY
jgi:hypothetical protein